MGAAYRGAQGFPRLREYQRVRSGKLEFTDMKELLSKQKPDALWIGRGYEWDKTAANRAYSIWRRGVENVLGKVDTATGGAFWMQGLKRVEDLYVKTKFLEGHTLIVGTTGAGKTRLYDILLTQLVARNEGPVIVIDPKGDHEMRENMRRACEATGNPERFQMFHPAYADRSVRIDPLKNWNRATEVASRIADLMPTESGGDPFQAIAWNALNSGIQGMVEIGEMPSIVKIRSYIEGGPGPLLRRVLPVHFERWNSDWNNAYRTYMSGNPDIGGGKRGQQSAEDEEINKMVAFYTDLVAKEERSSVLDGLITAYKHDREHFQKLIASLIPILSMLTSDVMGELLSPDYEDMDDDRPIIDMQKVIRDNTVLYIGLDSLSDKTVGSAIGAILLADLAAVAGDLYNYGTPETRKAMWICVDEASEVLNEPAVRILNKGRGAGMRAMMATQTMADVEVRMGGEADALQSLGNFNNGIYLRVRDGKTQEYVTKSLPTVRIEDMETGYREMAGELGEMEASKAGYSEALKKEDLELIPPALLGEIPDLQFFAHLKDGRLLKVQTPILTG